MNLVIKIWIRSAYLLLAITSSLSAQENGESFDLLLKGGRVIDPRNDVDAVRDVAIKGDRVNTLQELEDQVVALIGRSQARDNSPRGWAERWTGCRVRRRWAVGPRPGGSWPRRWAC